MARLAPLKWYGGKYYLADWIISFMPEHTHYVEPYAGGLAVLFNKPYEGYSEVVNDLDHELINFWRVLRSPIMFKDFQRALGMTPFSQEEFELAAHMVDNSIESARRFFIRCRQSRLGRMQSFATLSRARTRRGMNEQASSWLNAIEGLPAVCDRLKRVVLLNDDALRVIKQQDGPKTLFYLDPPYLESTRVVKDAYNYEMSAKDHRLLLQLLGGIQGKFILSGYDNELYDVFTIRNNWNTATHEIDCKASGKKTKTKRVEKLWMNF